MEASQFLLGYTMKELQRIYNYMSMLQLSVNITNKKTSTKNVKNEAADSFCKY